MATMLMTRTSRARAHGHIGCHTVCDRNMAPRNIPRVRRTVKAVEKAQWKAEVRTTRLDLNS